jgi:hypothetical protein
VEAPLSGKNSAGLAAASCEKLAAYGSKVKLVARYMLNNHIFAYLCAHATSPPNFSAPARIGPPCHPYFSLPKTITP